MKNYQDFKYMVTFIIHLLAKDGYKVVAKKWARISPYQKNRYKAEYQYPECWIYREDSRLGAVVTGEDIGYLNKEGGVKAIKQAFINYLF